MDFIDSLKSYFARRGVKSVLRIGTRLRTACSQVQIVTQTIRLHHTFGSFESFGLRLGPRFSFKLDFELSGQQFQTSVRTWSFNGHGAHADLSTNHVGPSDSSAAAFAFKAHSPADRLVEIASECMLGSL